MKIPLLICFLFSLCATSRSEPQNQFDPMGLFLTWQRDPTSTMTIQWLEKGVLLPLAPGQDEKVEPCSVAFFAEQPLVMLREPLWAEGLAIDFLASSSFQRFEDSVFSAMARLGWSERGMLFGFEIRQKSDQESNDMARLWGGSSVELVLIDESKPDGIFRVSITPGLDAGQPQPRCHIDSPETGLAMEARDIEFDVIKKDGGYILLALVPWRSLPGFQPGEGKELRAQIYVNNREEATGRRLAWFPSDFAGLDLRFAHKVRLGKESSPPFMASASVKVEEGRAICSVRALPKYAGAMVEVLSGNKKIGSGIFAPVSDQVTRAEILLPLPAPGSRHGAMDIVVGGKRLLQISPDLTLADYSPPESMLLEYWEKTSGGESRRQVKTAPTALRSWPGIFLHRVELTGLSPDTGYRFSAAGQANEHWFRTMPAALQRPVRIAIGGDTMQRKPWMLKTNRIAAHHDPDFILWGGDLADTNAKSDLMFRWRHWFEAIGETLRSPDGRILPVVVAVGNHDVENGYCQKHKGYEPTDAWRERIAPQFYEFFAFPSQPGYAVLDFGNYLSVVVLDSGHTNPIPGAQTAWLESTLAQRRNVPHVLPIYHIPAYPGVKSYDGTYETEVRKTWTPLFDKYAIRSAFENHNHAYKRTHPIKGEKVEVGGTVYFGDGGWGVMPREVHPVNATWYLKKAISSRYALMLTLDGQRQHFLALSDDGEVIDEVNLP